MSMSDERKTRDHRFPNEPAGGTSSTAEPRVSSPAAGTGQGRATVETGARPEPAPAQDERGVYFFPDEVVTATEVRRLLASDSPADRAKVVSRLLTYGEYTEIWTWVDRETVRQLWDSLSLPERLRAAWARNLGLVAKTD